MIAVILSFSDDPARLDLRPAHRERSAALAEQGVLLAGGPFADQSGALLVFATDDMEVVRAALDDDPYYSAPACGSRRCSRGRSRAAGSRAPDRARQRRTPSRDSTRSASGLPPVWHVAQYSKVESA